MNGFTEKDMNNLERIETIELVLEDFPRMNIINHFKHLRSLTLINASIIVIEVHNETIMILGDRGSS